MASLQAKFAGLGAAGVKVWKVERFDLVDVPQGQQGSFYIGAPRPHVRNAGRMEKHKPDVGQLVPGGLAMLNM